jgi:hypothetical protein
MGQFLPSTAEWGLPPLTAPTTSFRVIQQGSLVLDIIDPGAKNVVWRSVAQGEIRADRSPQERNERLREAIGDMFKKFPPKK